jgi:hypothetical protein
MAERTLIIHAGGGKAGSSALQSALSGASEDLAKHAISYLDWYPRSSAYEITPGNGFRLFEAVGEPTWDANGKETIEFFMGHNPVGICSSEFLGAITRKRWETIIETAADAGVEIKIIYFVRGAVGYVTSSYNQNVKRSGEARTLAEAVVDYPWQHYDELQNLDALFDRDHLRVINYDRVRNGIGEAFASAYPELAPAAELLREGGNLPVNRSLTGAELEVMRRANARFGSLYSHDISDRLIYEAPDLKADTRLPKEVAEIIAGKFSEATKWINDRFFPDGGGLGLELDEASRDKATEDSIERPLKIAFDWALEAIENRSTEITFIRERLLAIDWENSDDPNIPPDFDPIAYLLLNPDVLRAQLPPYLHFVQSGQQESRRYRWPLSVAASDEAATADAIKKFRLDEDERLANTPTWPRLRHSIQLEALLHQFAEREHEYLELIRKLRETHGYETEQFRQGVGQLLRPLYELVEGARREAMDGSAQRAADMQVLIKLAHDLTTQVAALWEEQGRLNATIERKDNDLAEQRDGFSEMIRLKDAELAEHRTCLTEKDQQLAQQAGKLEHYRNVGFWQYLKWGFQRDKRP